MAREGTIPGVILEKPKTPRRYCRLSIWFQNGNDKEKYKDV
jgi:hypothetical protein